MLVFENHVITDTMSNLNLDENDFWNYGKLPRGVLVSYWMVFPGKLYISFLKMQKKICLDRLLKVVLLLMQLRVHFTSFPTLQLALLVRNLLESLK